MYVTDATIIMCKCYLDAYYCIGIVAASKCHLQLWCKYCSADATILLLPINR